MDNDDSDTYNVERILGKRKNHGKLEYLVKWEGFPDDQNTWEPIKHLSNVSHLISEYENQNRSLCKWKYLFKSK